MNTEDKKHRIQFTGFGLQFVWESIRRRVTFTIGLLIEPILHRWYQGPGDRRYFDRGEPPRKDRRNKPRD